MLLKIGAVYCINYCFWFKLQFLTLLCILKQRFIPLYFSFVFIYKMRCNKTTVLS